MEFGNELIVGESEGGLIVDYMLYGRSAPDEGEKLMQSVERQQELQVDAQLTTVVTDRGFDAAKTVVWLEERNERDIGNKLS